MPCRLSPLPDVLLTPQTDSRYGTLPCGKCSNRSRWDEFEEGKDFFGNIRWVSNTEMNGSLYWIFGPGFIWKMHLKKKNCGFSCFAALCQADCCKLKCSQFPLFVRVSALVFKVL